jgi:TRAP-type C4-dicarboxylate transport system substrate-binding protein
VTTKARSCLDIRSRRVRPRTAVVVLAGLLIAGCNAAGASKPGGPTQTVSAGPITLTFAGDGPVTADIAFATALTKDSGGQLKLRDISYDEQSPNVDQQIASDLAKGKLDVGDVGSRAWESLGDTSFQAYQEPFLITSRELLDQAVTGPIATGLLSSLKSVDVSGLAIVPVGIRYLYSTRPLTTRAQFSGAKIAINVSATTTKIINELGGTPVTNVDGGPAAVQALRSGAITAIESDPQSALVNGYVKVAPYVLVNPALFAKTSTFAASSARLAKLSQQQLGWLREAAQQAAASVANSSDDQTAWAAECGEGLKPLTVTQRQRNALIATQNGNYAAIAVNAPTTLAIGRIGAIAMRTPQMDSWATCRGVGVPTVSPTKVLDGTYRDVGNSGPQQLTIANSLYTLSPPATPNSPNEIGSISISGDRVLQVPWLNQEYGSVPTTYTFELFRGQLTWQQLSGDGWALGPWKKVG